LISKHLCSDWLWRVTFAAAGASMSVESFAHETKSRHAVKRDG